jgi:hypothetical protein
MLARNDSKRLKLPRLKAQRFAVSPQPFCIARFFPLFSFFASSFIYFLISLFIFCTENILLKLLADFSPQDI